MKSRQIDDKAEGLWRVNDTIYDLTDFVKIHPGGADWIKLTKGTDITEAFETHHIHPEVPVRTLEKYKIRAAAEPRNFKFTFNDDGFFRTVKRNIGKKLKTIDRGPERLSKVCDRFSVIMMCDLTLFFIQYFIDGFLLATFLTAILSLKLNSTFLTLLSSLCLNYTTICAHNFIHKRDNLRMYYFNFCFLNYRDWRIQHCLSHHLYPNSMHDLEVAVFEPFLCWTPNPSKSAFQRYGSWIYSPLVYAFIFVHHYAQRLME